MPNINRASIAFSPIYPLFPRFTAGVGSPRIRMDVFAESSADNLCMVFLLLGWHF